MTLDDLSKRFSYHKPKDQTVADNHQLVRDQCFKLACLIVGTVPPGREQSLAITHLEETMMWANAGIARNQ